MPPQVHGLAHFARRDLNGVTDFMGDPKSRSDQLFLAMFMGTITIICHCGRYALDRGCSVMSHNRQTQRDRPL